MNLFVFSLYEQAARMHMMLSVPPRTQSVGAVPNACGARHTGYGVCPENTIVVQDRRPRRITSIKKFGERF